MKRLRLLLVAMSFVAGSTLAASAQGWGYPDRDDYSRNNRAAINARDFGYQDGFNDGRNDRFTGHSFRPTHDSNFKHADRGYYGSIDRNYYKELYREAYERGYQRGYDRRYDRDYDHEGWRRY
ncbi:MAG TPA: hypothetical protein VI685_03095 [Candidatus Angelobacter sp.]